ncbi:MAG: methionyl-tRNA formyltransferase [Lachnospiraceae bacterium]|nr:methionyl-tRNA formyltransferase [Lachnospiraceae bacterium]
MKVIYMGTPDFAVYGLKAIVEAGHEVVAVITQPDKAKGRSKALVPTPVKKQAIEYNIPVYQPEKIKEESVVKMIEDYAPEVIVVAAYGQILPESILNIPPYGCINIHASLLPKYRGAAPIEWSIIDGEEKTGVTTMYMEKGLDTGDMIEKVEIAITSGDTGATLHDKLAVAGGQLIVTTLDSLKNNTATRTKQDDSLSCYASMLNKDMGNIDFTKDAASIERLMRGLNPWPCAYTRLEGKTIKLFKADVVEKQGNPGEIIEVTKKTFTVACGKDALCIKELQPEGKKPMDTVAFLNGNKLQVGMRME